MPDALYRARGAADDETVRALFLAATLVLACCACGGGREAAPLVRVPDLRGLPTQQALERLAGARLCVWHIDREPGLGSRRERVVAQRPQAGSRVGPLHRVSFRVTGLPPTGEIVEIVAAEGCSPPPVPLFALP